MKRADYIEKRKEILAECKDKLSALDKVFQMFGGTPIIDNGSTASPASRNGWEHETSKRDAVREALKSVTIQHFSLKDVRNILESNFPPFSAGITDNQLSAILAKFGEMGELLVVKKKAGKSSAIYAKPSS